MASFFKTKKLKIETLGEYLRDTRGALKFTFAQIQRLTQIPEKFLIALEDGDWQSLPADVYVRGFLKSLAAVYKVPTEALLEQYERERGLYKQLKIDPLVPRTSGRFYIPRFTITPKTFTFSLIALLAVFSVGYLVWQVRSVSAPPRLVILSPENNANISTRTILLRGETEEGSKLYINNQEILVSEDGSFTEVISLAEGTNNIIIKSVNRFGKSAETSRTVAVSTDLANAATSTSVVLNNKKITIEVIVGPENSWIGVKSDGAMVNDGIIVAGQRQSFSAEKELLLTTGNAGSTRVIYNGQDLGVLGRAGEVLSNVRFTP